ncbi:MAG: hypothetical protein ACQEQL_00275 [Pseudomonadota bacterium]
MKKLKTTKLFATVAVAALALGVSTSPAQAFENVNWDWNQDVDGDLNTNLDLNLELVPAGLIVMEKTQLQVGDVIATSSVTGIDNNAPGEADENGFVTIDESFTFSSDYENGDGIDVISPAGPNEGEQLSAEMTGGTVDETGNEMTANFDVFGDVEFVPGGTLDGVDLPAVESAATAVGNNQQLETAAALQLHDGQFTFGGFAEDAETGDIGDIPSDEEGGNLNIDMMASLLSGGLQGMVEPAQVTATSTVNDILNASVDSTATSVANNMDITLNPATDADTFAIADVTQASYADVTATSAVSDITVNNYDNLGVVDGPLVNSAATAIGNNLSMTLNGPELD